MESVNKTYIQIGHCHPCHNKEHTSICVNATTRAHMWLGGMLVQISSLSLLKANKATNQPTRDTTLLVVFLN